MQTKESLQKLGKAELVEIAHNQQLLLDEQITVNQMKTEELAQFDGKVFFTVEAATSINKQLDEVPGLQKKVESLLKQNDFLSNSLGNALNTTLSDLTKSTSKLVSLLANKEGELLDSKNEVTQLKAQINKLTSSTPVPKG